MGFLIPAEIDPPSTVCVQLEIPNDPTYLANFRGLLLELGSWWEHEKDDAHSGTRIARHWRQVLDTMTVCKDTVPGAGKCTTYPPNADIITWQPIDPFYAPDTIPRGYVLPPLEVVQNNSVLSHLGFTPGDVVTELYRLPPGSLPTIIPPDGLPRFRISFAGTGHVELNLLNLPQGGYALVTLDDSVPSATLVDLNLDIQAVPPESEQEHVHEVQITTPGDHHIDVTFVPYVTDELIPIHFGGGLRSIALCGVTIAGNPAQNTGPFTPAGIQIEVDMAVFRQQGCTLQVQCTDGSWSTIYDPTNCIQQGTAQPPGTPPPAAGDCATSHAVLFGNNQYLLPQPVNAGDTLTITGAKGGWSDGGSGIWNCPNGQTYVAQQCIGVGGPVSGDPASGIDHMRLVMIINGVWYDAYNAVLTIPAGVTNADVVFQANDSNLSNNGGSIVFDVELCAAQTPVNPWAHDFNFATSGAQGWIVAPDTFAVLNIPYDVVNADGWESQFNVYSSLYSTYYNLIRIQRNIIAASILTDIAVHYTNSVPSGPNDGSFIALQHADGTAIILMSWGQELGAISKTWHGSQPVVAGDTLFVAIQGAKGTVQPTGYIFCSDIATGGTGVDPF